MTHQNKIPITIITGCLGSGKTTVLRKILEDDRYKKNTAVIVNEFGKIGLDHHLLSTADEKTVLLNGGCICCNRREDLEEELSSYLSLDNAKNLSLKRIIIETTGMADPAPILFTINTHPMLQHHFYIDCVITTVDAKNGLLHLKNNPEIIKQVTVADKIVLTKTDIASDYEKNTIIQQLRNINPASMIVEAVHGDVDPSIIEGIDDFNISHKKISANINKETENINSDVNSISFTFKKSIDWTAFGIWLSMLLHSNGENVLRVKGMLDVGEKGPVVLNGVQHIIHTPEHLKSWPEDQTESYLVFILRSIDPLVVLESLKTFQQFLGTYVELLEIAEAF